MNFAAELLEGSDGRVRMAVDGNSESIAEVQSRDSFKAQSFLKVFLGLWNWISG